MTETLPRARVLRPIQCAGAEMSDPSDLVRPLCSKLAQCGQRSEPSAAVDQPLGRSRPHSICVAPHAQENTATPSGTVAWLTKYSAVEGDLLAPASRCQRPDNALVADSQGTSSVLSSMPG